MPSQGASGLVTMGIDSVKCGIGTDIEKCWIKRSGRVGNNFLSGVYFSSIEAPF